MKPSTEAGPIERERLASGLKAAESRKLFCFDVQINCDLRARVVRAYGFGSAFVVLIFRPDRVIRVRRELSESVASVACRDEGADAVRLAVLQVHDCTGERLIAAAEHLALERFSGDVLRN